MKWQGLLLAVLMMGCTSTGMIYSAEPEVEYDKFNNSTAYRSAESRVKVMSIMDVHDIYLRATMICAGAEPCIPEEALVTFKSSSKGWRFLRYYPITLLIDGERIRFEESEVEVSRSTVRGSEVVEFLHVMVDYKFFEKFANARDVEAKIGSSEFKITFERREALRNLQSKIHGLYYSAN